MPTDPRDARLRRLYDISAAEYDIALLYQGGVCALCGRPPQRLRLAVDHEHKTGLVRGLLCANCNRAVREWMTLEWVTNLLTYLINPPLVAALGREPQGVIGRVTNKRKRRRKTS